jgi:hypothetical protein
MQTKAPKTRNYRLPVNVAELADRVAVERTTREQRPVKRSEVLRLAIELGLKAQSEGPFA